MDTQELQKNTQNLSQTGASNQIPCLENLELMAREVEQKVELKGEALDFVLAQIDSPTPLQ